MITNHLITLFILAFALTFSGCARVAFTTDGSNTGLGVIPIDPDDPQNPPPPPPVTPVSTNACSFDGTWQRCIPDGANSTRETLRVKEDVLEQTIETFIGSNTCEGIPGLLLPTIARAKLNIVSQALTALNIQNVDLINANLDLGCGLGLTSYTSIQFSSDCSQIATSASPGCSPDSRGRLIDGHLFILKPKDSDEDHALNQLTGQVIDTVGTVTQGILGPVAPPVEQITSGLLNLGNGGGNDDDCNNGIIPGVPGVGNLDQVVNGVTQPVGQVVSGAGGIVSGVVGAVGGATNDITKGLTNTLGGLLNKDCNCNN
ncbi:hypothetical protein [Pseudobdellovibrio exovorus]|uniref:Lipoprotein n=1 Tax=Pseudobdellovibrio exovorus JSS TaxID=1184267 RepID=M4V7P3_9BACT|nr:hypothetical protein [Pseudobdellovibrio exovorus]AGH95417.1 hypothetical protein A11Q_1201 [Pseudobdellovibrio exovorus JSS]